MWIQSDGITDSQARAIEARRAGDARCDLVAIAEKVAKALPQGMSELAIAAIAEALCEDLRDDADLHLAFDATARVTGDELVLEAMMAIAHPKAKGDAA
jgi:hypothetical protein